MWGHASVTLFGELRRRKVFRVAAAYAVVAWLLLQVADILLDNFGAPEWVFKSFTVMLVLGFPLAVILAWIFDLTPDGVRRTPEVASAEGGMTGRARLTNRVILIGALDSSVVVYPVRHNYPTVISGRWVV